VPDGVVSTALVHKTGVGDLVRLGPPIGTSVLDPDSRQDLLLVGGGTGLAPLKSLVDQLSADRGPDRRVWWFVGARRPDELYDLDDLHRMASEYPGLSIVLAVSDDPTFQGERGPLYEVFGRYGDWRDHDVYLAGPPEMVRTSLHRLAQFAVSPDRIRWDAYGELADVRSS
jgi:NAD(P)H-flavin reductase